MTKNISFGPPLLCYPYYHQTMVIGSVQHLCMTFPHPRFLHACLHNKSPVRSFTLADTFDDCVDHFCLYRLEFPVSMGIMPFKPNAMSRAKGEVWYETRMHFSWMRTVWYSCHQWGVSTRRVSARRGVCRGGVCPGWVTTPPFWTEWQTCVKTLPCRNYIADGKNDQSYDFCGKILLCYRKSLSNIFVHIVNE